MFEAVVNYVIFIHRFKKKKEKRKKKKEKKGRLKTQKGDLCKKRVKKGERMREPAKLKT